MDFTKFGEERIVEYEVDLSKFQDHITNTFKLLKQLELNTDSFYEYELQKVANICLFQYYVINFDKFRDILEVSNNFIPLPPFQVPRFWYQMIQQICRPMYYGNEIYIPKFDLSDNALLLDQVGNEITLETFNGILKILSDFYSKNSKSKTAHPLVTIEEDSLISATPFTSFKLNDPFDLRIEHYYQRKSRNGKVLQNFTNKTDIDIPVENIDHGIIESGFILTPDLEIPPSRIKAFSALLHCRFNQLDEPSIDQLINEEPLPKWEFNSDLIHGLNMTRGFANSEMLNTTRIWNLPVEFDGGLTYAIYNEFHSIEDELESAKKHSSKSKSHLESGSTTLTSNDKPTVKDADASGLKAIDEKTKKLAIDEKEKAEKEVNESAEAKDAVKELKDDKDIVVENKTAAPDAESEPVAKAESEPVAAALAIQSEIRQTAPVVDA